MTSSQAIEPDGTAWADFGVTSTMSTGATATALTAGTAGYLSPAVVTPPPAAEAEAAGVRSAEDRRSSIGSVEALSTPKDENEDDGVIEVDDDGGADDGAAELVTVEPVLTGAGVENIMGPCVKFTRGTSEGLSAVVAKVVGATVVVVEVRRDVTEVVEVVIWLTNTGSTIDTVEVDSFSCRDSEPKSGSSATTIMPLVEVDAASRGRAVVDRHEWR